MLVRGGASLCIQLIFQNVTIAEKLRSKGKVKKCYFYIGIVYGGQKWQSISYLQLHQNNVCVPACACRSNRVD